MSLHFMDENIRLGSHVGKDKSLTRTLLKALSYRINCAQMYLANSRGYALPNIADGDMKQARALSEFSCFPVYVHACLLYNLNGGTHIDIIDDMIAKAKTDNSREKYEKERYQIPINHQKTIDGLRLELDICAQAFGTGVIVHIGSGVDKPKAISRIAKTINTVLEGNPDRHLILENAAGEGNKIGSDIQDIVKIISLVDKNFQKQISICIDTCHLYAAGEYDIERAEEWVRFFTDFASLSKQYGVKPKIKLFHLNDSKGQFGCRSDRHEDLGKGFIFGSKSGKQSLKTLVRYCNKRKIDMILETPGDHFEDIYLVESLC